MSEARADEGLRGRHEPGLPAPGRNGGEEGAAGEETAWTR